MRISVLCSFLRIPVRRHITVAAVLVMFPLFAWANGGGHAHDAGVSNVVNETAVREGMVINMNASPVPVETATTTRLDFFVNEKPAGTPIPFHALDVEHTKLMHVIGVRSDLNEFRHIHPEPDPERVGFFTIEHDFFAPGDYAFWSEVSQRGVHHAFQHSLFAVEGTGAPELKTVSLARNVIVGDYQVSLAHPPRIAKGKSVDLFLDVHTLVGDGVALGDYLGEKMHLAVISEDLRQFVHAHPSGNDHHGALSAPTSHAQRDAHGIFSVALANGPQGDDAGYAGAVNFHVTFPAAGWYKLFAQFRPEQTGLGSDEALTAEFWIEVRERAVSDAGQWWGLFFGSLVLMAGLSVGVHRYIHQEIPRRR